MLHHKIGKENLLFILFVLLFVTSCQNKGEIKKVNLPEGVLFIPTSATGVLDGTGKLYNGEGILTGIYNYKNGKREGLGVNLYKNGVAKDSVQYTCGVLDGIALHYDTKGKIQLFDYNYYGLQFGPEILFKETKPRDFYFRDLNKSVIVSSHFGENGIIDSIYEFKMDFRVIRRFSDSATMNEIFAYLPEMGSVYSHYSIGLTDEKHHDKSVFAIAGKRYMFDTLMPLPPAGFHYFISCHLQTEKSKVDRVYIEELIDTLR